MIDIKKDVAEKLSRISGVKINYYYPRSFNELPVITYYELSNSPEVFADDLEYSSNIAIQVDVWALNVGDMTDIAIKVSEIMVADGFKRAFAAEFFESGTGIHHKTMRFEKMV